VGLVIHNKAFCPNRAEGGFGVQVSCAVPTVCADTPAPVLHHWHSTAPPLRRSHAGLGIHVIVDRVRRTLQGDFLLALLSTCPGPLSISTCLLLINLCCLITFPCFEAEVVSRVEHPDGAPGWWIQQIDVGADFETLTSRWRTRVIHPTQTRFSAA
jgi:hypothetical protein